MSKEEKAYTKCLWIMEMLKAMKTAKADYETVTEYAARVLKEKDINLTAFSRILDKLLYSTIQIEDDEYHRLNLEYDEVFGKLEGREKLIVNILGFLR